MRTTDSGGVISGLELIKAMIRSGEKAVADFSHISGGEWFDEAPEYFLSTYVARSVGNYTFALLEVPVDKTRKEAGAVRRGRPANHERRDGRFDVVLYWENGNPRAVVEIKSPIWDANARKIHPDINRLCSILLANSDSTLQFGAFLFYASVSKPERKHDNATERMRDLLDRIKKIANKLANKNGAETILIPGSVHRGKEEEDGAWSIASIVITRARGTRSFSTK